jgi:DNA-binding response OmpR family regulator
MSRILIVDDDLELSRSLARAFGKLRPDLAILTAPSAAQAIRMMQERSVDIVLTDLQMPEMDGFELLAWLRSHCPDVSVFMMSAYGTSETAAKIGSLGGLDYFPKPVDATAVLARLTDALAQSVHGHVNYVSLASFLQLLEMERKTCTLSVSYGDSTGYLVVRRGQLVAARSGEKSGEEAAITIVAWPYPSISISRQCVETPVTINSSLGFILIEAMRIQDEAARNAPVAEGHGSVWPTPRRTWRPTGTPASDKPPPDSSRGRNVELSLPSGARGMALVETATGNVLRAASRDDCPLGELARMASQLLLQEAATLELCSIGSGEGVEELVLSTSTRCDVIKPLGATEFALLVFAPEETNLVMARIELEHFIALYHQ